MGDRGKSEGKINGPARRGLPSQSGRWLGAARHPPAAVLRGSSLPHGRWVCHVPCPFGHTSLRRSSYSAFVRGGGPVAPKRDAAGSSG
jgi:hypothetical protein